MSKKQLDNASALQTVHGTTSKTGQRELTRFQAFKRFFIPRLAQQERLALAYEEAAIRKVDAEGEKLVQEAAKLAAEKDLAKQEELRLFCETVEKIFEQDDSPNKLALKFAKLLETNPEIANQLEKVQALLNNLERNKECRILIEPSQESEA